MIDKSATITELRYASDVARALLSMGCGLTDHDRAVYVAGVIEKAREEGRQEMARSSDMTAQTTDLKWSEADIEFVARAMFGDEPFDITPSSTAFYEWAIETAWTGIAATLEIVRSQSPDFSTINAGGVQMKSDGSQTTDRTPEIRLLTDQIKAMDADIAHREATIKSIRRERTKLVAKRGRLQTEERLTRRQLRG